MNDVKKGIFEIDGIEISRNTKVEEVVTEKMTAHYYNDNGRNDASVDSLAHKLKFIGGEFSVHYAFFKNKLAIIELAPLLGGSPGYPDLEYQKVKWDYCCQLLRKEFGKPDYESEENIKYSFENGYLNCYQILEGRMEGEGGKIEIWFLNRGDI